MVLLDYIQFAVLDRLLYATIIIFFSLLPFAPFLTNTLIPTGQVFNKYYNHADNKPTIHLNLVTLYCQINYIYIVYLEHKRQKHYIY